MWIKKKLDLFLLYIWKIVYKLLFILANWSYSYKLILAILPKGRIIPYLYYSYIDMHTYR